MYIQLDSFIHGNSKLRVAIYCAVIETNNLCQGTSEFSLTYLNLKKFRMEELLRFTTRVQLWGFGCIVALSMRTFKVTVSSPLVFNIHVFDYFVQRLTLRSNSESWKYGAQCLIIYNSSGKNI